MNLHSKLIYICNYNVGDNRCQWLLSDCKEEASSIDPKFQLASITDLRDWVAATGKTFNGILTVREGECKWFEQEYVDEFGEIDTEYEYKLI